MEFEEVKSINKTLGSIIAQLSALERRVNQNAPRGKPGNFTAGSVLFAGADKRISQDNTKLFWDDTNDRLGIGTSSPGLQLETKMKGIYPALSVAEKDSTNRRATIGFGVNGETATTGWIMGQGLNNNTTKDFYLADLTANLTRLYIDTNGNVGIGPATTIAAKLYVNDAAAASIEANSSNTNGFSRIRFVTNTRTFGIITEGSTGGTFPGQLAIYDYTASAARLIVDSSGHVLPGGAGAQNLGNASQYWNDISYKTITDRGCLALISEWELMDGRKVSNLQVFREMKPHAKDKTIYGEVKLDYNSVPKHSHKPAPIAQEDVYEDVDGPEPGKKVKKLKHKKGEKVGEDGVEMTSIFSMMIGAIRELANENDALKSPLEKLEVKQPKTA
jgi:hypothetical protein